MLVTETILYQAVVVANLEAIFNNPLLGLPQSNGAHPPDLSTFASIVIGLHTFAVDILSVLASSTNSLTGPPNNNPGCHHWDESSCSRIRRSLQTSSSLSQICSANPEEQPWCRKQLRLRWPHTRRGMQDTECGAPEGWKARHGACDG
jgi:hypothetical protein